MKKTIFFLALLLALVLCTVSVSASTASSYDAYDSYEGTEDGSTVTPEGAALTRDQILTRIAIAFLIAFVGSLIAVLLMKRALNTVRPERAADRYTKEGSFSLTECRDIFLYSTVTRVRINTDSNKKR
ncbi:MAG: hypothetical protein IJV96_00075 [Clostridia bacterium]|nr:hypothetical protein [Clostridia bacterium]